MVVDFLDEPAWTRALASLRAYPFFVAPRFINACLRHLANHAQPRVARVMDTNGSWLLAAFVRRRTSRLGIRARIGAPEGAYANAGQGQWEVGGSRRCAQEARSASRVRCRLDEGRAASVKTRLELTASTTCVRTIQMIYLFTNMEFGLEFRRVAATLAREMALKITIVLSGKTRVPAAGGLSGRYKKLRRTITVARHDRRLARLWGLPVMTVEDVNSLRFVARIGQTDHGFVAGFNQIFRQETIGKFASLVNCHPSLLPYYRGPVPTYWCIRNGERKTGYTFHRIVDKIDRGEILWQEVVTVEPADTPESLNGRIARLAAPAFERYLNALCGHGDFPTRRMDAAAVYLNHVDYLSFPKSKNQGR